MPERFLITGGNGNLARQLAFDLARGGNKIVLLDISGPADGDATGCEFVKGDITDPMCLRHVFERYKPSHVLHMASMLSGSSENDRQRAWQVNAVASIALLELSLACKVECFFFPSTAATYGTGLADPLPEDFPQWPENFYGVTKVAVERAGCYFYLKKGLNFRSIRLPFVISRFAPPGALTAYASHAFVEAVSTGSFSFPVRDDSVVSSIYVKDVIAGILNFIQAPNSHLTRRVYNVHGCSPTAGEIASAIKSRMPDFIYAFNPDVDAVRLTDAMPVTIQDNSARNDWGWNPVYDLEKMTDDLLHELQKK
jgi:threonine 3-dehydrogenase